MKITKLILMICVGVVLVPVAQAQTPKGLKYIPQAAKSTKAIPYAVNPKLPFAAQLRIATPIVRPGGTSLEVERAMAAAIAARQEQQTRILARLATQLPQLEKWAQTHDNKLPTVYSWVPNTTEEILMDQVLKDVRSLQNLGLEKHPLLDRYNALLKRQKEQHYRNILNALLSKKELILGRLPAQLIQLDQYLQEYDGLLWAEGTSQQILQDQVSRDVDFLKTQLGLQKHALVKKADELLERVAWNQQQATSLQASLQQKKENAYFTHLAKFSRTYMSQEREDMARQKQFEKEQEISFQEELAEAQQRGRTMEEFEEVTGANAAKAAQRAETILFLEGNETTEEFVEKLLNLYDLLDPLGNNILDADAVFNTPEQWVDKLQKFVDKYHRIPRCYSGNIASQQMLDEFRLAKAVYGLVNRLPEENPVRQRIEELFAKAGENQETRIQRAYVILERGRQLRLSLTKTPQQVLDYVTRFMSEHNGKLPAADGKDPVERSYRRALKYLHQKSKGLSEEELGRLDEASHKLEKLYRTNVRTYTK